MRRLWVHYTFHKCSLPLSAASINYYYNINTSIGSFLINRFCFSERFEIRANFPICQLANQSFYVFGKASHSMCDSNIVYYAAPRTQIFKFWLDKIIIGTPKRKVFNIDYIYKQFFKFRVLINVWAAFVHLLRTGLSLWAKSWSWSICVSV